MAALPSTFPLALEQFQAGRLQAAEQTCRQLIAAEPSHADAWNLLGVIAYQQGQDSVAAECLTRALQSNPDHVNALNNLGTVFRRQNKLEEAIACHRRALELRPESHEALNNLGSTLIDQGCLADAADCFQRAITADPSFPVAHFNLGTVLQQQGALPHAEKAYRRALELHPVFPNAHFNLAIALKDQGKLDQAIACFRRAAELNSDDPKVLFELGVALHHLGNQNDARSCYERVLQIDPNHANAHFHLALLLLVAGDFDRGFPEYEWRWKTGKQQPSTFHQPQWDGSNLAGKTILLCAEQGLGDTIQFIRYAPLIKYAALAEQLDTTVIVQCLRPLVKLLSTSPGIDQLIAEGEKLPHFDCYAPLLSLPRILKTTLDTIPASAPYLSADPALVAHWRQKLDHLPGFRVGINWRGGVNSGPFGKRDIPLDLFASLADLPGIRLISLQKEATQQRLSSLNPEPRTLNRPPVISLPDLDTTHGPFIDTAAIMKNLDLVITSDTSIAHLAGALGVAVWVALPFAAEWRWLVHRADSPWYSTMRLFRQTSPGDWPSLFAEIRTALLSTI